MALPKIQTASFELTQPSNKKTLNYRPFVVKEEKILMMARESGERKDMFQAVKQIVNNCVIDPDFSVDEATLFDLEYIFLKLRAVSIDNIVKFQVQDSNDGILYDLEVNLNEVEVTYPEEVNNTVTFGDNMGLTLSWPNPTIAERLANLETVTEIGFETIKHCIDTVYDEEDVYSWKEVSEKEKEEFIDNLPLDTYKKIESFFEAIPRIEHVVNYTNSEGTEKKVVFRQLEDFFALA